MTKRSWQSSGWTSIWYPSSLYNIDSATNNPFDFYIIDSLEGIAESLVVEAGLVEEKVAFLSSTKSFIESVRKKGYKAYLKKDVDRLIQECF